VGGCCGTTPEHVRRMAEALADVRNRERGVAGAGAGETRAVGTVRVGAPAPDDPAPDDRAPVGGLSATAPVPPMARRSALGAALASDRPVTVVELVPPRGWDAGELLARGAELRRAGVDAVSIPDAPRGLARMGSLAAASLLARGTGVEVIAHYACRDRNMIGMISDLLGAAASGIPNLLLVTGDLSPTGRTRTIRRFSTSTRSGSPTWSGA
jgi:methionine synthase / methylenetetrahydrofolate reductase(NADPH)